jgi:hypothetical protein
LDFTASSYTLKTGTVFSLSDVTISDGDTHLQLTVNFTPTAEQEYTDTLVVSAAGAYDFVIPLRGTGISWTASPLALQNFGDVFLNDTSAIRTVTVTGSRASGAFSYSLKNSQTDLFPITEAAGYNAATTGGNLEIRFTPTTWGLYRDTLLLQSAGSLRTLKVPLAGSTPLQPVVSADSTLYRFGEVEPGNSETGGRIKFTLLNAQSHLDEDDVFTFARAAEYTAAGDSIFKVARKYFEGGSVQDGLQLELTLSFAPQTAGEHLDTLIVRADYANEYRIPLSGTGSETVGIDRVVETLHATSLRGNIIVTGATPGSRVSVYNLAGQALKTQTVSSNAEIIETSSFPQSIYIVVVDDNGQVILRQKIVL